MNSVTALSSIAIVVGSFLVALAIYHTSYLADTGNSILIQRSVVADRNLYGSPEADTVIVEFSDYECPFCAQVHSTLKELVDGSDGTIAWEYRHLPLGFHPLAEPTAIVAECLRAATDNETFWQFTDTVFANQKQLSGEYVSEIVTDLGVTPTSLESCISDPNTLAIIKDDANTAAALGGSGTPFSVIVFPDGSYRTISGAVPYEEWRLVLESYGDT